MIIPNKSYVSYNSIMPNGETYSDRIESNLVTTEILSYLVTKTIHSDKTSVNVGDYIRVTTTITNRSSAKLVDILFTIAQSSGMAYVDGSVKINGNAHPIYHPVKGFTLPELYTGEEIVIEYQLKVISPIATKAITHYATFKYGLNNTAKNDVTFLENTDKLSFKDISKQQVLPAFSKSSKVYYTIIYICPCCNCCECCDYCHYDNI